MSLEVAAMKVAIPAIGVTGGASLFLLSLASTQTDIGGVEKYGAMGLLALLLVWMTQVLSKKLDTLIAETQQTRAEVIGDRSDTQEMRASLERMERRLEVLEDVVQAQGGTK